MFEVTFIISINSTARDLAYSVGLLTNMNTVLHSFYSIKMKINCISSLSYEYITSATIDRLMVTVSALPLIQIFNTKLN